MIETHVSNLCFTVFFTQEACAPNAEVAETLPSYMHSGCLIEFEKKLKFEIMSKM